MPKINILDKHVAELIAAGEVVERPCSVVKELVENSVDAGATVITVELKNGGVTYLRVTDNGCGIAREDVRAAFLRHATSKVKEQDDLDTIGTLGFRGEALASVAGVARVELLTCAEGDECGTRYVISGGEEELCEDAGCPRGSTLVVRDLFYNIPARMKFLKKDMVEANAIAGVLDKLALSHPEVSLRFVRDGKETLHTPGDGKLKSAVYAVYGREFTASLLPVEYEYQGLRLSGFISKPSAARPNRSMQQFFINGRYIKSRTAAAALEEAFKGSVMAGKQPACVLHLEISFAAVDVNVHPAKLEVRFINERPIFDCVYHGVKTALNKGETPAALQFKPAPTPFVQPEAPVQTRMATPLAPTRSAAVLHDSGMPSANYARRIVDVECEQPIGAALAKETAPEEKPIAGPPEQEIQPPERETLPPEQETQPPEEAPARLLGEAFGTYIILETGDELLLIDKHAAHERLLYEQLKAARGGAHRQLLLAPVPVTLDKNEYAAVLEALELCAEAGFELEDFGTGTVLVRSAPMILPEGDAAAAVMELAGYLHSAKNDITTEKLDWLYHNVACRAAVKAGDESSARELLELVRRVNEGGVRHCPHGRPVSIAIKRRDLERQFGRV